MAAPESHSESFLTVGSTPRSVSDNNDLVIGMEGVAVRRGKSTLLHDVDWSVELDERWVVLGPNGAGKTTLLKLAAAELHPTQGAVHVLGERLGRVNVFELRTRIGLTSAALGMRVPGDETVQDVVVSAGYGVLGRWREQYDTAEQYGFAVRKGNTELLDAVNEQLKSLRDEGTYDEIYDKYFSTK